MEMGEEMKNRDGIVVRKIARMPDGVVEVGDASRILEYEVFSQYYGCPETGRKFFSVVASSDMNLELRDNGLPDAGIYEVIVSQKVKDIIDDCGTYDSDGEFSAPE